MTYRFLRKLSQTLSVVGRQTVVYSFVRTSSGSVVGFVVVVVASFAGSGNFDNLR